MQHLIGINCHFPCLSLSLTLFLLSINLLSIVIIILFIHHLTLHLTQLNSTLRCTTLHKNFSVDPQRLLSVYLSVCLSFHLSLSVSLPVSLSVSSSSPLSVSLSHHSRKRLNAPGIPSFRNCPHPSNTSGEKAGLIGGY